MAGVWHGTCELALKFTFALPQDPGVNVDRVARAAHLGSWPMTHVIKIGGRSDTQTNIHRGYGQK
jgi:hypothetical protein